MVYTGLTKGLVHKYDSGRNILSRVKKYRNGREPKQSEIFKIVRPTLYHPHSLLPTYIKFKRSLFFQSLYESLKYNYGVVRN